MKPLKRTLLFFALIASLVNINAQTVSGSVIEESDLNNLLGAWKGTLTYMDYSSNKPYTMPSSCNVVTKKKNRKLMLNYKYSNEPKANGTGKLKISKDRSSLNGKPIISRKTTSDGDIEITTEYSGKDGNDRKKALIRNVYIIGTNNFIIRKEVRFEGTNDWIKRNEYNFKKTG